MFSKIVCVSGAASLVDGVLVLMNQQDEAIHVLGEMHKVMSRGECSAANWDDIMPIAEQAVITFNEKVASSQHKDFLRGVAKVNRSSPGEELKPAYTAIQSFVMNQPAVQPLPQKDLEGRKPLDLEARMIQVYTDATCANCEEQGVHFPMNVGEVGNFTIPHRDGSRLTRSLQLLANHGYEKFDSIPTDGVLGEVGAALLKKAFSSMPEQNCAAKSLQYIIEVYVKYLNRIDAEITESAWTQIKSDQKVKVWVSIAIEHIWESLESLEQN